MKKQETQKIKVASLQINREGYVLLSGFILVILLIMYVWWPLVVDYFSYFNPNYPVWRQLDRLLIGIFLFMSVMILSRANLKTDVWIIGIGMMGGLVIESWGTQTELWTYYTLERPPMWIIPAWPIASLTIDRLYHRIHDLMPKIWKTWLEKIYWPIFSGFYLLMLYFVWPTLQKPMTIIALLLSAVLILQTKQRAESVLVFLAGSGLGYFLELWGTTRSCWTYYTFQTPPFFAVLAHGMAAVAFWRVLMLIQGYTSRTKSQ